MRCDYLERDQCHSCTLLHLDDAAQVERKTSAVRALLDLPDPVWLPPATSARSRFRNKAKLVVGGTVQAPLLGIRNASGVQDLTRCPLHESAIEDALPALRRFVTTARLEPYDVTTRSGELKYLLVTTSPSEELLVRLVLRSREAETRIRKHLPTLLADLPRIAVFSLNIQPQHAAVLEGPTEIVLHGDTLTMTVDDLPLHLRPQSFFQTNTAVATALYRRATTWLTELSPAPRTLWDLYCGVGGFALHAARAMPDLEVLGVEVSGEAIASAQRSAADLALPRARFVAGDATTLAPGGHQDDADRGVTRDGGSPATPDVVVVNPPRRGIGPDLAGWLERSGVPTVVYSSCNATTLARDLQAMPSLRPVRAQLLDMFPNTDHYEVIALLRRQ